MAATEWFYQLMDVEEGPVTSAELKRLATLGTIEGDTLVRKGDAGPWTPADRVKGLFPQSTVEAPPAVEDPATVEAPPAAEPFVASLAEEPANGNPPVYQAQSKLIHCPDCGTEVSPRATLCPKCGCPVGAIIAGEQQDAAARARKAAAQARRAAAQERKADAQATGKRGAVAWVFIAVMVPALVLILWFAFYLVFIEVQRVMENGLSGGNPVNRWPWINPVSFVLAIVAIVVIVKMGSRMERKGRPKRLIHDSDGSRSC